MFGHNEIVGKKFFAQDPLRTLRVTSMFYTLQGEGPKASQVALFIRLAKCNLACSFCDTFFDAGDLMTFEQIEARSYEVINAYFNDRGISTPLWALPAARNMEHRPFCEAGLLRGTEDLGRLGPYGIGLVITGGEPLLQPNLEDFLARQTDRFNWVQIESNGTVDRRLYDDRIILVISPKCAEKNGKVLNYLKPSAQMLERADCLKFVVSSNPHSPYHTIPQWAFNEHRMQGTQIFISPMNIYNDLPHRAKLLRASKGEITLTERSTVDEVISFWEPGLLNLEANQRNHEYAARYCLDHGFTFNLQQHLYASLA